MSDSKWVAATEGLAARVRFHEAFRAAVAEHLTLAARTPDEVAQRLLALLANQVDADDCNVSDTDVPGWVDFTLPYDGDSDRFVLLTASGERFVVTVERVPALGNCDACDLPGGVEDASHGGPGRGDPYLHTACPPRWR